MRKNSGFNLLELMTAFVIICILSTVCLPLYSQHLVHEKRLEAEITLVKAAEKLEQYFLINNTYQDATPSKLGIPERIAGDQYQLMMTANDTGFLIKAVPLDSQSKKDSRCGVVTLDSHNTKGITGSGNIIDCWN